MWQMGTPTSLRNIYLFCVDSGWTCPDKPSWTFNKSSHWRRKTFKTDWLTADSFMTKLLLLRWENSSLAKSMIVYSCVSLSPLIWPESFTSLQHYKTRLLLIDCSYDSSCHVTPVAFLQCVITSPYQSLLFMHNEEDVYINRATVANLLRRFTDDFSQFIHKKLLPIKSCCHGYFCYLTC